MGQCKLWDNCDLFGKNRVVVLLLGPGVTSLQSLRKCEVCYEAMSFVLATDKNEPRLETNTHTTKYGSIMQKLVTQ